MYVEDITPQEKITILNQLYEFLRNNKPDNKLNVVEIITSFCEKYDLDVAEVGEIVSEDRYLKDMIYYQCMNDNMLRGYSIDNKTYSYNTTGDDVW